jgi:hypothetical protein
MMNKWNLEVGDLLMRGGDIGVVHSLSQTAYGSVWEVHWTWTIDGNSGTTHVPEQLLCKAFFTKFQHIKRTNSG